MKVISKCEREFIYNVIKKHKRLDGRELSQGRTLEIVFGKERGCCIVIQGNTRVLVQVSCEVTVPKASTPTEGIVHVNFELSPMASPDAASYSRTSDEFVVTQRSLERCILYSKCIELESLCIFTGSKVWTIRVDIHALNDDGNLTECASIAAISALAHFRRPAVTVVGDDVTIHSIEEKPPVALNLHHMPISINLALFDKGKYILIDPTDIEEKVCEGCYIIGMNAHEEVCFTHRRGAFVLEEDDISRIEDVAARRAQEVTQIIRSALDDDAYKRATDAPIGFANLIQTGTILGAKHQMAQMSFDSIQNMPEENDIEVVEDMENTSDKRVKDDGPCIKSQARERAICILEQESEVLVFEGGPSKWGGDSEDELSPEIEKVVPEVEPNISAGKERSSSDSEEETAYINKELLDKQSSDKRGWFIQDPFA